MYLLIFGHCFHRMKVHVLVLWHTSCSFLAALSQLMALPLGAPPFQTQIHHVLMSCFPTMQVSRAFSGTVKTRALELLAAAITKRLDFLGNLPFPAFSKVAEDDSSLEDTSMDQENVVAPPQPVQEQWKVSNAISDKDSTEDLSTRLSDRLERLRGPMSGEPRDG